ncbi:hypothetical protein B0H13DRAFT_1872809 [Mycena leptocephala]|nr:hypothetical protein B0H13DRAFT_1872809 [Mycena leptocephala]
MPNYETSDHPQYGRISLYNLKNDKSPNLARNDSPKSTNRKEDSDSSQSTTKLWAFLYHLQVKRIAAEARLYCWLSGPLSRLFFSMLEMSEWPTCGANFVFSSASTTRPIFFLELSQLPLIPGPVSTKTAEKRERRAVGNTCARYRHPSAYGWDIGQDWPFPSALVMGPRYFGNLMGGARFRSISGFTAKPYYIPATF